MCKLTHVKSVKNNNGFSLHFYPAQILFNQKQSFDFTVTFGNFKLKNSEKVKPMLKFYN